MENLKFVLEILKNKKDTFKRDYFIPKAWNTAGCHEGILYEKDGEICINPYEYYACVIENHILRYAGQNGCYNEFSGERDRDLIQELKGKIIYSILVRAFTAWYHTEGVLSPGTFLKTICLLPYLKNMNVDIIYLLPVFEYGTKYKKGDLGSPYAIKNIYKLDKNLHDPLLGEFAEPLIETEFKAFVEACHILGIKVMVDFVFRTVSRDNDLLVEHPDWFYWIDLEYADCFSAPVTGEKEPFAVDRDSIGILYRSEGISKYIAQFTYSPDKIDPEKWAKLVERHKKTGENILGLIESEFKITTVPGFSDVVNDSQPPWTDVTFLKFYFDLHEEAKKYVGENTPPYIMQDGVRLSVFRGRLENRELIDYITGVIPYYQKTYGIDGARIDMAHALSPDLNTEIIKRAKAINENFILWSEEFDPVKAENAKKYGYHFITGTTWEIYNGIDEPGFNSALITDNLLKSGLPVIAALETPDTPRAALRYQDKRILSMLVFLNYFIPNAVPFINNGMEVMEIQPMNLGLGNTEAGRFVLDRTDPMYGKLAFFDAYCIHWKNTDCIGDILSHAGKIRKSFSDILTKKENFIIFPKMLKHTKITSLCYYDNDAGRGVIFVANRDKQEKVEIDIEKFVPAHIGKKKLEVVYAGNRSAGEPTFLSQKTCLGPCEFLIISIQ